MARTLRIAMLGLLLSASLVRAQAINEGLRTGGPYVPTPQEVVDHMLKFANVGPRDFVIDLGSGDGRMVITAAQRFGARGLGVDIDPELVERSRAEAERLGLGERARFRVEDATRTPLADASVVTLYLLPGFTRILQPRFLSELTPGSRIVAHDFDLGDWKADREVVVDVKEKYGSPGTWKSTLFLWTVPAQVSGTWQFELGGAKPVRMALRLEQKFQDVSGSAVSEGASLAVSGGRLEGKRIRFRLGAKGAAPDPTYEGVAEGDRMSGTVELRGERVSWSATRAVAP